jgi:hypothetical protein
MKINSGNYLEEHRTRIQREMANSLIEGCYRIVHGGNGLAGATFRGNLTTLSQAMGKYGVWIDFPLTTSALRSETEAMRSRSVEIIFHDENAEIELVAASAS